MVPKHLIARSGTWKTLKTKHAYLLSVQNKVASTGAFLAEAGFQTGIQRQFSLSHEGSEGSIIRERVVAHLRQAPNYLIHIPTSRHRAFWGCLFHSLLVCTSLFTLRAGTDSPTVWMSPLQNSNFVCCWHRSHGLVSKVGPTYST